MLTFLDQIENEIEKCREQIRYYELQDELTEREIIHKLELENDIKRLRRMQYGTKI